MTTRGAHGCERFKGDAPFAPALGRDDELRPVLRRDRVPALHGASVHVGNADVRPEGCGRVPFGKNVGEGLHTQRHTKRIAHSQDETYREMGYAIRMEPSDRLRLARTRHGCKTAADAARRFGWPLVTYRSHENGVRGLTRDNVKPYAKAFKVSEAWLLTGEGGDPSDPDLAILAELLPQMTPAGRKALMSAAEAFAEQGDKPA